MGGKILTQDEKQLRKNVREYYGDNVTVRNLVEHSDTATLQPEPPKRDREKMVAGSVYQLPFADQSVDLILAHRLFEHIVFPEALPELLRVIKPGGEIRLSGIRLYVFPNANPPLVSQYELDFTNQNDAQWIPHPGWMEQMQLLTQKPNLQTTLVSSPHTLSKPKRLYPDLESGEMIILRQDKKTPSLALDPKAHIWKLSHEEEKQRQGYYRTFRLEKL
jgi:SAM-dependent methyltransferase